MKTRKRIFTLAIFTLFMFALMSPSVLAQQKEEESTATLPETMDWMKSKLSGMYTYYTYHQTDNYKNEWDGWFEVTYDKVNVSGCELSYTASYKFGRSGSDKTWGGPVEEIVNLSKFDPLVVRVQSFKEQIPDGNMVEMKKPVWVIWFRDNEYSTPRLLFNSEDMAKRFHKAVLHAIKKCGGKVEPF